MSATQEHAKETGDVRAAVRERYGAIAVGERPGCCGGSGCCSDDATVLDQIGYTAEQQAAIPEGANLGLGCGNPLGHADVRPGEVVLDLGSGAGIDCFLAAREVGPSGRVIGVDMTAAMIERARAHAGKAGYANVEFRLGEIEHLPVADGTVDLVISNCVINLSPDKPQTFREAFRVLRPGGRLVVSDLVLTRALDPELQKDLDLYVGCVAGASVREDYLAMMRDAGFLDIAVLNETVYEPGADAVAGHARARDAFAAVRSLKVRARKP